MRAFAPARSHLPPPCPPCPSTPLQAVSHAADDVGPERCEALYCANQAFLQLPFQPLLADAFVAMVKDHCHNLLDALEGGATGATGGDGSNSEGAPPRRPPSRGQGGSRGNNGGSGVPGAAHTEEHGSGRSSQGQGAGPAGSDKSLQAAKPQDPQLGTLSREGACTGSPRKGGLLGAASGTGATCSTSESPRASRGRRPAAGDNIGAAHEGGGAGVEASNTPRKGLRSPGPSSPRPPRQNKTQKKEMEQGVDALLQLARHASNLEPGHSHNAAAAPAADAANNISAQNHTGASQNHAGAGTHPGDAASVWAPRGGGAGKGGGSGSEGGQQGGKGGQQSEDAAGDACHTPSRAGKRKTRPPSRLDYQVGMCGGCKGGERGEGSLAGQLCTGHGLLGSKL